MEKKNGGGDRALKWRGKFKPEKRKRERERERDKGREVERVKKEKTYYMQERKGKRGTETQR